MTVPFGFPDVVSAPDESANDIQGDSDSIGCRIKLDDAVKDERSANTRSAFTYGLDKCG